jgi:hypothetical protein
VTAPAMPRATPIDEDGLKKLAHKAQIEREQLNAFRTDMSYACQAHRRRVQLDAKDQPRGEAAELAKIVKSLNKFRRAVAPNIAELRRALDSAPIAVLGMALPPAGQCGETALPLATLFGLPELLGATVDYVAKRRIAVSARIERHRPTGAADMRRLLAIVLWQVAEKYSPRLSARPAEKQDWLHDALRWCGAKPPKHESRRFKTLVEHAAAHSYCAAQSHCPARARPVR